MTPGARRTWSLALCAVAAATLLLLLPNGAFALETQLCGIRLGDHATRLMEVHGPPDGIVVGTAAAAAAQVGVAGGVGGPAGALAFPSPFGAVPGVQGPSGGGEEEGDPQEPSSDEEGGGEEGGGGGGGGGGGAGAFPTWALPLWVTLRPGETEWIYNASKNPRHKSPVVMGFVLDSDGFVTVISVAGKKCSYAATAGDDPRKRIHLGDVFETIIKRYQFPDEFVTFSGAGGAVAQPFTGTISVTFAEGSTLFARDLVLKYTERSNVAFTLHDMEVTRIHIWSTE